MWRRLWLSGDDRRAGSYTWRPPTNVYETEGGGIVQVEIAGLQPGDFRVAYADAQLTIVGVRRVPAEGQTVACQQMEIASGRFLTRVDVSWPVEAERIRVDYRDGFLFVYLLRRGLRTAAGDTDSTG